MDEEVNPEHGKRGHARRLRRGIDEKRMQQGIAPGETGAVQGLVRTGGAAAHMFLAFTTGK